MNHVVKSLISRSGGDDAMDAVRLTWPDKGRRASFDSDSGRWTLGERDELHGSFAETAAFGEEEGRPFDPMRSNLLVQGDNLPAMAVLARFFRGRVHLAYLDPPYNTGQTFEHYPDCQERSAWLTMMYERLELVRELLASDGSIYVQLDWNMAHYCKVLMDEVFGEASFQREIIWRIGWVSGFKSRARNYIRNHDTILFYTRDPAHFVFNKTYLPHPPGYRRRGGFAPAGRGLPLEDTWNCSAADRLDSIQIKSFSGEKTGFRTQKNEELLARIIGTSSNPGDLILDCFAGSGTTGAVAHKLGRRWVMIEAGDQVDRFCLPRLKAVIAGEDQTGISRKAPWAGGGGFRLWRLEEGQGGGGSIDFPKLI